MEYKAQYQEYLLQATAALDAASARFLPEESEVCRAARYSLLGGGKRIRAILTLSVCDMLGGDPQTARAFSAAVEMLHCYSLIHDDLPCMDNDDLRRGRPSCHKAFGEATAMLAGDVIVDDVLDVTSTPEQLGKPIGSDSENGKTTFATLYGVEGAMALAQRVNEKTCSALRETFGEKSAFLEQLAQQLLTRKN